MSNQDADQAGVQTPQGISDSPAALGLCRDCGGHVAPRQSRCQDCGSRRVTRHAELNSLSIAHIDCDAFYASVEKATTPLSPICR